MKILGNQLKEGARSELYYTAQIAVTCSLPVQNTSDWQESCEYFCNSQKECKLETGYSCTII